MASLPDKDTVYLHQIACPKPLYLQESMIPCCCEVLQVIREDRNIHEFLLFALRLSLSGVSYSSSICQAVGYPGLPGKCRVLLLVPS